MIVQCREFHLLKPAQVRAQIWVDPAGLVEVDIEPKGERLLGEPEQLSFEEDSEGTRVVCRSPHGWQLCMNEREADCLKRMIRNAEQDLEDLMRDL